MNNVRLQIFLSRNIGRQRLLSQNQFEYHSFLGNKPWVYDVRPIVCWQGWCGNDIIYRKRFCTCKISSATRDMLIIRPNSSAENLKVRVKINSSRQNNYITINLNYTIR